ncbi:hypothetical protein V2J09_014699 [Rumex salicifolius]
MALLISSSARSKPSMLKDYLLDDFGSCSSGGFHSFPRRQCCVAVRNLIEVELRGRRSSSGISCAIRKASTAIVSAMKLLRFKSPAAKKSLLPRSFSRGIGKRRLLKKRISADDRSRDYEIERWISSGKASPVENHQPLDLTTTESTTVTITSASSSSNGDSWSESDSEFTLTCSNFHENGVVRGKRSSSADSKRCRVSLTVADESIEPPTTKNNWSEEEKENFSPVSILNFPEDNEEAGSCSPFTHRLNHLEGTREKLMQKLRRFECLSRIDPTNIESRLYSDDNSPLISLHSSPSPQHIALRKDDEAERLLKLMKAKVDVFEANNYITDGLLVDFFLDGLVKGKERRRDLVEEMLMEEAGDWLTGKCHDQVAVGWKVKEKRKVYAKDLEEDNIWRSNDVDKEEIVVEVEAKVFGSLVDELVEELILYVV